LKTSDAHLLSLIPHVARQLVGLMQRSMVDSTDSIGHQKQDTTMRTNKLLAEASRKRDMVLQIRVQAESMARARFAR